MKKTCAKCVLFFFFWFLLSFNLCLFNFTNITKLIKSKLSRHIYTFAKLHKNKNEAENYIKNDVNKINKYEIKIRMSMLLVLYNI